MAYHTTAKHSTTTLYQPTTHYEINTQHYSALQRTITTMYYILLDHITSHHTTPQGTTLPNCSVLHSTIAHLNRGLRHLSTPHGSTPHGTPPHRSSPPSTSPYLTILPHSIHHQCTVMLPQYTSLHFTTVHCTAPVLCPFTVAWLAFQMKSPAS